MSKHSQLTANTLKTTRQKVEANWQTSGSRGPRRST